ncbi:MAG: hypothetical protein QOI64_2814 [Solirubrobacteraceae bacterium]|jgi:hypothetical protein|nr:hypothetical protein [Solirubrobacteraceae bacterium]
MNHKFSRIVALGSIVAVGALGAPALATPPAGSPSEAHKPATTPGPNASPKAKANAYGKYCANQSKKHVAGQKGTPFSQCVTAMAKAAKAAKAAEAAKAAGTAVTKPSPAKACAALSKKKVGDEKKSAFSKCVVAAAKVINDTTTP